MSAFLVSNFHVNAMATFAVDQGLAADAASCALMLWIENRASLRARYETRADEYWSDLPVMEQVFRYEDVTLDSLWTVIKGSHCYAYQACEHGGWATSDARRLADRIVERACEMLGVSSDPEAIRRNANYEAADWGLEAGA